MNNANNVLDIPEIQKHIREFHGKFIKKYGMQIEKVMADQRLLLDTISAKIHRVILCFKEEGVIDDIRTSENGSTKTITLLKRGCSSYVDLVTNGKFVILKSFEFNEFLGSIIAPSAEYFYDVDKSDYDWVKFSIKLLDFIHSKVYERQEVLDEKIKGMLSNDNKYHK